MKDLSLLRANLVPGYRQFDQFFDHVFRGENGAADHANAFSPVCDIEEAEGHYFINLDVPGVAKDEIQIEVHDNTLTVSGERKSEVKDDSRKGWLFAERLHGKFSRSFKLGQSVDSTKIEARYRDGVLSLSLPKAEAAKSRQIK